MLEKKQNITFTNTFNKSKKNIIFLGGKSCGESLWGKGLGFPSPIRPWKDWSRLLHWWLISPGSPGGGLGWLLSSRKNPKMTWNTTYKHSKWWFWKLGAWKNPGGYWLGSRGVHAAGLTGVSSTKKELSRTSIKSSRSRILESWWLNDQLHKLTLR